MKKKRSAKQLAADKARSEAMKARLQPETVLQAPPVEDLQAQINELKSLLSAKNQAPTPAGATLTQGGVVGTVDRYNMNLTVYPDPRPRLQEEPRLVRFAFGSNYDLEWEVSSSRYQTIDGIWRQEPKFTLELIGHVFDEDTGEPTNKRYTMYRGIFFEDPEASMIEARNLGLNFEDYADQETFLNEMRYLRYRNWLLEAFFPPKNDAPKTNKREMVIGNKLVDVWETSSTETQTIPFEKLKSKL